MSLFDDYKLHRERYTRLKKRKALAGTIYEFCPICGEKMEPPEMHHPYRRKHDNLAFPNCCGCHDVFKDREQFEHPPLSEDIGDDRERQRRVFLSHADLHDAMAAQNRSIANSLTFKPGTRIVVNDENDT